MFAKAAFALLLAPLLAGCLGGGSDSSGEEGALRAASAGPFAVIAHIDTGINPYHVAFRWDSPLAWQHPSTYLEGYPANATALNLTFDAPDYASAVAADAEAWAGIEDGALYWIPGTRIVAAVAYGDGGRYCPLVPVPPANQLVSDPACPEPTLILDDFGHGTMTASRMAGGEHSLAPDGLIASLSGDERRAMRFVSESGWIDVVSNSWGSLAPSAASGDLFGQVEEAARHALYLFASGNGLGFINGVVGQPTYQDATAPLGVVLVGAHDNGYATFWHGFPVHVIADGYAGWRADSLSLDEWGPDPEACCTSAAAPYAAGAALAILLEARRLLGDPGTGFAGEGDEGLLASGAPGAIAEGPIADGNLTLGELKRLLLATATPTPPVTDEASDDGLVHWVAGARPPANPWPGDNPYCFGCWTSPVPLSLAPQPVAFIGYGAVNNETVAHAAAVLAGLEPMPERPDEDAFFAADRVVRGATG